MRTANEKRNIFEPEIVGGYEAQRGIGEYPHLIVALSLRSMYCSSPNTSDLSDYEEYLHASSVLR
jgi:hypothetical protein